MGVLCGSPSLKIIGICCMLPMEQLCCSKVFEIMPCLFLGILTQKGQAERVMSSETVGLGMDPSREATLL